MSHYCAVKTSQEQLRESLSSFDTEQFANIVCSSYVAIMVFKRRSYDARIFLRIACVLSYILKLLLRASSGACANVVRM